MKRKKEESGREEGASQRAMKKLDRMVIDYHWNLNACAI